jgi:hypothetical protein
MNVTRAFRACLIVSVLALALATATGCLIVHEESGGENGRAVATANLGNLSEGVTTREDLIDAFGSPTQIIHLEGGREILIYVYEKNKRAETGVLFLMLWTTEDERTMRFNFELKDGVLVRYWKEDIP